MAAADGYMTIHPEADDEVTRGTGAAATATATAAASASASTGPVEAISVVRWRWAELTLFCSATFTNAFLWIAFAPIAAETADYYDVDATLVNMLSMCFMFLYLPGTLLATYLMDKIGLRKSMIVAVLMNALSGWIRYLSCFLPSGGHAKYVVLFIGQCVAGLSQPFFTNAPSKLAGSWFAASEREIATTIAALFNPLGNAAGSVVPAVIVTQASDMPLMLLVSAIFATVTCAAVTFLFRGHPPLPPSVAASRRLMLRTASLKKATGSDETSAAHRLWIESKQLLSDKNYLALMVGFGVGLGLFNSVITLIAQLIQPCGYDSNDAGTFGGILIGCGLLGAAIAGPLLEKTKAYKPILKIGILLCGGAVLFFFMALRPDQPTIVGVAIGVMGFCMIPLLPVVLENTAESTYPIPEEAAAGLLLFSGQVFGIIFIFVVADLINKAPVYTTVWTPACIFTLASISIAGIACFLFNGEYRRQAAESHNHQSLLHDAA